MTQLIKLGKQIFEMDPLKFTLNPIDTPENVEDLDIYDGNKIAKYVDTNYDGKSNTGEVPDKFNKRVKDYKTEQQAATTTEEIKAISGLKPELAVYQHAINQKKELAATLEADIEPIEPPKTENEETETTPKTENQETETNETPENETPENETPQTTTQTTQTETTKTQTEENNEQPKTETPETKTETISDKELNQLLTDEGINQKELVTAAATIVKNRETPNLRNDPDFIPNRIFDRALDRNVTDFVTASEGIHTGQVLKGGSNEYIEYLTEAINQAFFKNDNSNKASTDLGRYQELHAAPYQASFLDRRNNITPAAVTASGEVCDVEQRDVFPNCDNLGDDLTGLFQTIATDKCEVQFRKDISMWNLAPGITYWSKKRYADYHAARDDLNATIAAASNPATPAELTDINNKTAAVTVLQKRCADVGCMDWTDTTSPESISACINYSTRQEDCSPNEIRRHIQLLEKLFLRARNSYLMNWIDSQCYTINVDCCLFKGLDFAHILDEVVPNVISRTDEKERRTSSQSWVGIASSRFMQYASSGLRKSGEFGANPNYTKTGIEGLSTIHTTVDNVAAPVDALDPASEIDLIPTPTTLGDAYPNPGDELNYGTDLLYPTTWTLYVIDPADAFAMRKSETRLAATFNHESAKGNMVHGPFMENTVGYGKDGCTPWKKFVFTNAENTGGRVANIPVQTACP